MTTNIIASSIVKKAGGPLTMSINRTYTNRRSRENEYSNSTSKLEGRVHAM